jgi:hypothetical protein
MNAFEGRDNRNTYKGGPTIVLDDLPFPQKSVIDGNPPAFCTQKASQSHVEPFRSGDNVEQSSIAKSVQHSKILSIYLESLKGSRPNDEIREIFYGERG